MGQHKILRAKVVRSKLVVPVLKRNRVYKESDVRKALLFRRLNPDRPWTHVSRGIAREFAAIPRTTLQDRAKRGTMQERDVLKKGQRLYPSERQALANLLVYLVERHNVVTMNDVVRMVCEVAGRRSDNRDWVPSRFLMRSFFKEHKAVLSVRHSVRHISLTRIKSAHPQTLVLQQLTTGGPPTPYSNRLSTTSSTA